MSDKAFRRVVSVVLVGVLVLFACESPGGRSSPQKKQPVTAEQKAARQAEREREDKLQEEKQEQFMRWALDNTAVTDIEFGNSQSIFVTLSPDKYTNKDNVQAIAEKLAKYCALQTGENYVTVHVYLGKKEYAKGRYSR